MGKDQTLSPGLELGAEGSAVGRDPRQISGEEFALIGHLAQPVLSAIRAKCLDCCGAVPSEVRLCTAVRCPLWPYRMGTNPLRSRREISDEQRAALRARLGGIVTVDPSDAD
jgi:hypothetical protein